MYKFFKESEKNKIPTRVEFKDSVGKEISAGSNIIYYSKTKGMLKQTVIATKFRVERRWLKKNCYPNQWNVSKYKYNETDQLIYLVSESLLLSNLVTIHRLDRVRVI